MTQSASEDALALRPQTVRTGDVRDLTCTDLIAKTGQGVGRIDGMAVFVLGPLPGERARVRVVLVKAKYVVAELVELLEISPERVEPFCPVFGRCGGCQVQHLAYDAQLRWKASVVDGALRRIGGILAPRVRPTIGMADPRRYRNKTALVVRHAEGATRVGFYAAGTHELVEIDGCPVVLPQLDAYVRAIAGAVAEPLLAAALADARHVVARVGGASGEGVVAVTTAAPSPPLRTGARALAARLPGLVGLSNSSEPPSENAVLGRRTEMLVGRPELAERIADVRFRVSAASFFQVNGEMVGRIFAYLAPAVGGAVRIVDCYCGAGTFALFFASQGATVIGIEENPGAVREATAAAALNGVADRATFLSGRVDRVLRSPAGGRALASADVVFLDPPRKGSDEATLDALVEAAVPHLWYLSCNPATLARDLARLLRGPYVLDVVQPFDMFPQTGHVEALAVLRRRDRAPLLADAEATEE